MVVECVAILGVIALVIFGFLRGGRSKIALVITPLLFVPFAHLMGELFYVQISNVLSVDKTLIFVWIDVLALAISSGMIVYFSTKFQSMRTRKYFVALLGGYSIILTFVFLYNVVIIY